ncbi:MAG TPA: hypothetical protein VKS60_22990, partial [Stellaceae bacterium]|nr:hypothetical protein [Stellaceae bacterium]
MPANKGKKVPEPDDVMSPAELRPILALAKHGNPVACAIGLTKTKEGVILVDKRLKPKKVRDLLKKQASSVGLELDNISVRFGRALVNSDASGGGTLIISVNKEAPPALRLNLRPYLKKAGFTDLEIKTDEQLESESEEDDKHDDPAQAGAASAGLPQFQPVEAGPGDVSSPMEEPEARVLTTLTVDPPNAWIVVGDEAVAFSVTGDYSDGISEVLTTAVEWHSSNDQLIAIDAAGQAVAKPGRGPVTLTATHEKSPGSSETVTGSAVVTVVELEHIVIEPRMLEMAGGTSQPFKAIGSYSEGPSRDLTMAVEWRTSDADVVAIDGNGRATAKSVNGHADITAKTMDGRVYDTIGIDVSIPILKSLSIEPDRPPMISGEQQFTATGHYVFGRRQDVTQDETEAVEWSVVPADVLSIENSIGKKGLATAKKAGTARITVTEKNSGMTASIDVGVAQPYVAPPPVLRTISIVPSRTLIAGTVKFRAMGRYTGGPDQDLTDRVTWRSSAEDVVTIDPDGAATAQPKS